MSKKHGLPAFALLSVFTLSVAWSSAPAISATCAGGDLAMRAGTAFISAAKARSNSAFSSALSRYVDMRRVSNFALGKYKKKLPANRKAEFYSLTSRYVSRTLTSFSRKFRASSLKVKTCRGGVVMTNLLFLSRPSQKIRWRIKGSKVTDVQVQNVWLAQILRSNFGKVMSKSGGDINALFVHIGGRAAKKSTVGGQH